MIRARRENNYLGLRNDAAARANGDFFLTGDCGVVHLDAHIFYQITDPEAFVLSVAHVEPALVSHLREPALSLLASGASSTMCWWRARSGPPRKQASRPASASSSIST